MNRLEQVRNTVDALLRQQSDNVHRRCGFVHLYGVSTVCALLAVSRGLDIELCATAGMLHDLSSYETGNSNEHERRSASRAQDVLADTDSFSPDEIGVIAEAICAHSAKGHVDGPMAELLKDADVLQHYLYNPSLKDDRESNARLKALLVELSVTET